VRGWDGADVEQGNAGADRVGTNSYDGGDSSDDIVRGGPGPDTVLGGWGNDQLYGGPGSDDVIDLECGHTLLSGGGGDDYLESWWSSYGGVDCNNGQADKVLGEAGDDTAQVNAVDSVRSVEHVTQVP
jgi:Ca2+-binding RTX toxin-like protein